MSALESVRRPSFRRRMTLAAAAAVAIAIVAASALTYVLVRAQLHDEIDQSLRDTAEDLSGDRFVFFESAVQPSDTSSVVPRRPGEPQARRSRRKAPVPGSAVPVEPPGPRPTTKELAGPELLPHRALSERLVFPAPPLEADVRYAQIVPAEGRVARPPRAEASLPGERRAREVAAKGQGSFFSEGDVNGVAVRVYTRALDRGAALQVARPLDEVEETLGDLATVLALVALGGIVLGAGLALLVTRASMKPVAGLNDAAQHVARTRDLTRRIDAASADELGSLASSFNTMLEALERSMQQQRQLVADASHELRTPLTSLRTNIEVLARAEHMPPSERRRLLADVVGQLEELSVLVGDLVDLAREDEDEPFRADLRLDHLVGEVIERARRRHPERDFRVDAVPVVVEGIAARVDRAVANLLDNAEKWSPPGAPIDVRVHPHEVVVRDHGPGIDDEDAPFVFDRFYRAPAARKLPGSGLGLAIVKHVADTHGGGVSAHPAPDGGAVLRLSFPASNGLRTAEGGDSRPNPNPRSHSHSSA